MTLYDKERIYNEFQGFFGDLDINQYTANEAASYKNRILAEGKSASIINSRLFDCMPSVYALFAFSHRYRIRQILLFSVFRVRATVLPADTEDSQGISRPLLLSHILACKKSTRGCIFLSDSLTTKKLLA